MWQLFIIHLLHLGLITQVCSQSKHDSAEVSQFPNIYESRYSITELNEDIDDIYDVDLNLIQQQLLQQIDIDEILQAYYGNQSYRASRHLAGWGNDSDDSNFGQNNNDFDDSDDSDDSGSNWNSGQGSEDQDDHGNSNSDSDRNCLSYVGSTCDECTYSYYLQPNNGCKQTCPQNYYKVNSPKRICESCQNLQNCQKCSDESTCTECLQGFFPDSGACQLCSNSIQNCKYCQNSSICEECETGLYILANNQCVDDCQVGYFKGSTHPLKCKSCSQALQNCDECVEDGSSCTKCSAGKYRHSDGKCYQDCPRGFYKGTPQPLTCESCSSSCEECSSGDQCTKCANSYYIQPDGSCDSSCPATFYQDSQTMTCQSCSQINSCINCDVNGCYECSSSLIIQPNGTCQVGCPEGYFSDSIKCQACPGNCQQCSNDTICEVCADGYYLKTRDNQCYSCSEQENCKNCQTDLSVCTECADNFYVQPDNSCNDECDEGFYKDETTPKSCKQCPDNCKNCDSDSTFCDTCYSGYYKSSQDSLCYSCSSIENCTECVDVQTCTSCTPGFYLQPDNTCLTTCPEAHYPSPSSGKCEQCSDNCQICEDYQSCSQCSPQYYINPSDSLCSPCTDIENCKLCQPGECSECLIGFYLHENTCMDSCPDNYFNADGPPAKCDVCPNSCEICEEASKCLKCQAGTYLQSDGSCETTCPEGQWGNSNSRECKVCLHPCKTCEHGVEQQACSLCKDDRAYTEDGDCKCKEGFEKVLNNGVSICGCSEFSTFDLNGQCSCIAGYVKDTKDKKSKCVRCPQDCGSGFCFIDAQNEVQCICEKQDEFIQPNFNNCLATCPSGYYKNTNNRTCEKCNSPCTSCQDNQSTAICSTCENKYTFENNQCICKPPFVKIQNECTCPENSSETEHSCKCNQFYYNQLQLPQLQCAQCPDRCSDCELSIGVVICSFCQGQYKPSEDKKECVQIQLTDIDMSISTVYENKVQFETQNVWFDLTPATLDLMIEGIIMKHWEINKINANDTQNSSQSGGQRILQGENDAYHSNYIIQVHDKGYEKIVGKVVLTMKPPEYDERIEKSVDVADDGNNKSLAEATVQILVTTAVSGSFAFSIFSGNNQLLWCLINTIQIIMFIPMTGIDEMPNTLIDFLRGLLDYNPLPSMFNFFLHESSPPYNEYTDRNGYSSSSFFLNCGDLFTSLAIALVLFPIFYAMLFIPCGKVQGWLRSQIRDYKWNVFTRFLIEGYLELSIAALIQVHALDYDDWEYQMHSVSAIIVLVIVAMTPVIMLLFMLKYNRYYLDCEDENFKTSWDSIYGEFKVSKMSLWFYYWFIIRRGIYAFNQTFLSNFPKLQGLINLCHSFLNLLFICVVRPYKDKSTNRISIVTEVGIVVVFGLSGLFVYDIVDPENLSWLIILLVIGIISFQVLSQIFVTIYDRSMRKKNKIIGSEIVIPTQPDNITNYKKENVEIFDQSGDSSLFNNTTLVDGSKTFTKTSMPKYYLSNSNSGEYNPERSLEQVDYE